MQKRTIIWFNPHLSKSVSTNVSKIFLQLITKIFPEVIEFTQFLTATHLKSATAGWTTYQKSLKNMTKESYLNPLNRHQNLIVENKTEWKKKLSSLWWSLQMWYNRTITRKIAFLISRTRLEERFLQPKMFI